jgi:hypothetical protein
MIANKYIDMPYTFMLFFPVFDESDPRLFTLSLEGLSARPLTAIYTLYCFSCPITPAVSMGRRNTSSKSTCRGLNS